MAKHITITIREIENGFIASANVYDSDGDGLLGYQPPKEIFYDTKDDALQAILFSID